MGLKGGGDGSTVFLRTSMVESSAQLRPFHIHVGVFFSPNIKKRGAWPGLAHSTQAPRRFIEVLKCSRIVGFTAL